MSRFKKVLNLKSVRSPKQTILDNQASQKRCNVSFHHMKFYSNGIENHNGSEEFSNDTNIKKSISQFESVKPYHKNLLNPNLSKLIVNKHKRNYSSDNKMDYIEQLKEKAKLQPKTMTDDDWTYILTPEEFDVTRKHGTERPFSCKELYYERRSGVYHCICCHTKLFSSKHKYDSQSGWPSFYDTVKMDSNSDNIQRISDRSFGMNRVEVKCKNCDAHLGHVFNDGPPPTSLRYCINGVSMKFVPENK